MDILKLTEYAERLCKVKDYDGPDKMEFAQKEVCKWIERLEREKDYWAVIEPLRYTSMISNEIL